MNHARDNEVEEARRGLIEGIGLVQSLKGSDSLGYTYTPSKPGENSKQSRVLSCIPGFVIGEGRGNEKTGVVAGDHPLRQRGGSTRKGRKLLDILQRDLFPVIDYEQIESIKKNNEYKDLRKTSVPERGFFYEEVNRNHTVLVSKRKPEFGFFSEDRESSWK